MSSELISNDDHSRTIIHIDLDCFYAQVEMLKNEDLRNIPFGVRQKNIIVTSNYLARDYGIGKCMLVSEAMKLCPKLTLVNGEDLHDYRQMSSKVHASLQKITNLVEKLGLDENFIDVTELVKNKQGGQITAAGHIYGSKVENCYCGCFERLNIGSVIAAEIRQSIKKELGLSSSAGIAHNKLLAKLVGALHKPDQQTVLYPSNADALLFGLGDVRRLPGIGASACEALKAIQVKTVQDLRSCPLEKLEKAVGAPKANLYADYCYGKDSSVVKPSGRPQSIGLEDSCRLINVEKEVEEKFRQLLHRLMILVSEDGRIPRTLKVTVRKYDARHKNGHREQRQCNISPALFTIKNTVQLVQNGEDKLMTTIMHLFHKLVDISHPFHVTLLGLAFTKFQERQCGSNSIASFFVKNLSVQSVTNLESDKGCSIPMDYSTITCENTDGSESDVEPSPKKTKRNSLIAKRRCLSLECPSPSKLRVADMRLTSLELDQAPIEMDLCPEGVDIEVFQELPIDVRKELLQQWKMEQKSVFSAVKKPKTNTLLKYLIKN